MNLTLQSWVVALLISLVTVVSGATVPLGTCTTQSGSTGTILCCLFPLGTLASVCAPANISRFGVATCPAGYSSATPMCCKAGGLIGPPNWQYNTAFDCAKLPITL